MDFKKIVDQVKDKAGELKDKAEEKIQSARASMDKDGDNIPDALEGLADKAKTLAGEAQAKAKDLAERTAAAARERMGSSGKDDKKA